jgi:hypothetical protein
MNVNTPLLYVKVRPEYVSTSKTPFEGVVFGACSLQGRALLFHVQLNNGAVYYRLPIDAFYWKPVSKKKILPLSKLQPWDCSSYQMEQIIYDWLQNQRVTCIKLKLSGSYVCTFDWMGKGTTAEVAHEHKCLHLIKLDNGQFALQPNNYILWHEKSNVVVDDSILLLTPNLPYPSVE